MAIIRYHLILYLSVRKQIVNLIYEIYENQKKAYLENCVYMLFEFNEVAPDMMQFSSFKYYNIYAMLSKKKKTQCRTAAISITGTQCFY